MFGSAGLPAVEGTALRDYRARIWDLSLAKTEAESSLSSPVRAEVTTDPLTGLPCDAGGRATGLRAAPQATRDSQLRSRPARTESSSERKAASI